MASAELLHDKETFLELRERFDTDKEIAEYVGVSPPTVYRWKCRHELGKDNRDTNGVYFGVRDRGVRWLKVSDSEKSGRNVKAITEHALAALGDGADPYKVFGDKYVIHHKNKRCFDNRPKNVILMTSEEHHDLHQDAVWTLDNDGEPVIRIPE